MAAVCLLGLRNETETAALVARVPYTAPSAKLTDWLRGLYPPQEGEWAGRLQPDRLAERHTVQELTREPELAARCLADLDERQALQAITLLGRASAEQPEAVPLLLRLLPFLEDTLGRLPADPSLIDAIYSALPRSPALLPIQFALLDLIQEAMPEGVPLARAHWARQGAVDLIRAGLCAEALRPARVSVTIYRMAVEEVGMAQYRFALARALMTLAKAQMGSLEHQEALEGLIKSTDLLREPDESDPTDLRGWLVQALSDMSIVQYRLHSVDEAIDTGREVVALHRELGRTDGADPHGFGSALSNLGAMLYSQDRLAEAREVLAEAVSVQRALTADAPEEEQDVLGAALTNFGRVLWASGELDEARAAAIEARDLLRGLIGYAHRRYAPMLVPSLYLLADVLAAQGAPAQERLDNAREFVQTLQHTMSTDPEDQRDTLAAALEHLARAHHDLNDDAALQAYQQRIGVLRELFGEHPDSHRPALAQSLHDAAAFLVLADHDEEALEYLEEALSEYRVLFSGDPDAYRRPVAKALADLSGLLGLLGRREQALPHAREASSLIQQINSESPVFFVPSLPDFFIDQAARLRQAGEGPEALSMWEEAAALLRPAAETDADVKEKLAAVLYLIGQTHFQAGCHRLAVPPFEEAVSLARSIGDISELAIGLSNLGGALSDAGLLSQAEAPLAEAVELLRSQPDAPALALASALFNYAELLERLGRGDEAAVLHAERERLGGGLH